MSVEPSLAVDGLDRPENPDPAIEIVSARSVPRTAAPTLEFEARIEDRSDRRVFTIALSVLIVIEPAKRSYGDADRERLVALFGEPERWAGTTENLRWTQLDVLVPSFAGSFTFPIPVECTYDLEVAAARYLHGVAGGEAPLRFHFNGTVYYEGESDRLQLVQIPWDCTARFSLPVATWKAMMAEHYPGGGWLRLDTATIDALERRRAERGDFSIDATIADLLRSEDG